MALDLITGFVRDARAAHRAAREIDQLYHMSTAQLSDLGLDRTQIANHAFRKYFKTR